MLNIRSGRYIVLFFAWAAAASYAEAQTCFGELCPGRIWNPPAFQWDIEGVYVPTRDEYFVATTEWTLSSTPSSGGLVGRFLDSNGNECPSYSMKRGEEHRSESSQQLGEQGRVRR